MTVSVIIPTFNCGSYLERSIKSALDQSFYGSIEVVIIDDGSTDETRYVIEQFTCLDNVSHFTHHVNRGKLAALNTASHHVSGDYVVILDADDELITSYLAECVAEINSSNVDFVYTGCDLIDDNGNIISQGRSIGFEEGLIERYSFIPDCALTSRDAFFSVIPLDDSIRRLPKHYRWKRICANGFAGSYLDRSLFRYRMHESNMSGIGRTIKAELADGHKQHHLLTAYWDARAPSQN